jgi:hypothetical protein
MPCAFDVSIEALAFSKRKRPMFLFVREFPREPPGHTPPAFLFLSSTMSKSREEFLTPPTFCSGRDLMPGPLARVTGLDRQLHQDASRGVCAVEQRAPLSDGGYMWGRLWVSSGLSQYFCK